MAVETTIQPVQREMFSSLSRWTQTRPVSRETNLSVLIAAVICILLVLIAIFADVLAPSGCE